MRNIKVGADDTDCPDGGWARMLGLHGGAAPMHLRFLRLCTSVSSTVCGVQRVRRFLHVRGIGAQRRSARHHIKAAVGPYYEVPGGRRTVPPPSASIIAKIPRLS
eukprot:scaffold118237_cov63-Phaeocystis_antarctica.AAC.2